MANKIDVSRYRNLLPARVLNAIDNLKDDQVQYLNSKGDIVWKSDAYFSRLRVKAAVSGAGPYTFLFAQKLGAQALSAFGYGLNETGAQLEAMSGLPSGWTSTRADTNILKKGEPNGGEIVIIDGFSIVPAPATDPEIVSRVSSELYLSISMNGTEQFIPGGPPILFPGGGGFYGGGQSVLQAPNLGDARAAVPGSLTNGIPSATDYRRLTEVLPWAPKGWGDTDFSIRCETMRAVTWNVAARAADVDANDIQAFTPPTATDAHGSFFEFYVVLHSVQLAPRSRSR